MTSNIDASGKWKGDPRDAFRDGFIAALTFHDGKAEAPATYADSLAILARYRAFHDQPAKADEHAAAVLSLAEQDARHTNTRQPI